MPDDIRKGLIKGMGDYARANRLKRLKEKYSTGVPALDEVAESTAKAGEDAHMPKMGKMDGMSMMDKAPPAGVTVTIEGGNSKLRDEEEPLEDEEFQKWLEKQKGP